MSIAPSVPCSGESAIPIEAEISRLWSSTTKTVSRVSRIFSAVRPASPRPPAAGSRTTNSSPPKRAIVSTERRTARSRGPICASRASPTEWPNVSLTSLNRSRSISSTASEPASRRAPAEGLLEPVLQEQPVRKARQRVVEGLMLERGQVLAPLADVSQDADPRRRLRSRAAHGHDLQVDGELGAVPALHEHFPLKTLSDGEGPPRLGHRLAGGDAQHVERLAQHVRPRQAASSEGSRRWRT